MLLRPTAVIGTQLSTAFQDSPSGDYWIADDTQPFEGCQEARELLSALAVMRDRLSDVACASTA